MMPTTPGSSPRMGLGDGVGVPGGRNRPRGPGAGVDSPVWIRRCRLQTRPPRAFRER